MQCTRYAPAYYRSDDLNLVSSGISWHPFVSGGNNGEERDHGISLPPFNMGEYLSCDKHALRQIINYHEAIFRHQVQELHRLYRRQRELIDDEIKAREILINDRQLQMSESNHCLPGISRTTSENSQDRPFFLAKNFQESSTVRSTQILDLQLPADAYQRDFFEEGIVSKSPEGMCNSVLVPVKTDSSFKKPTFLIDLNEPVNLESMTSSFIGPSENYSSVLREEKQVPMEIDLNSMPSETEAITLENLQYTNKETEVEDKDVVVATVNDKFLKMDAYIDLNTGVMMADESFPPLSSKKIGIKSSVAADLDAPVSPENKEGSPPRGKADDIQIEPAAELDGIAAETLILISSRVQQHLRNPIRNSYNCLYWFSEIVVSSLENGSSDNDQEIKLNGIDDFEEITQNPSQALNAVVNLSFVEKRKENDHFSKSGRRDHGKRTRQRKDLHKTGSLKRKIGRNSCAIQKKQAKSSYSDSRNSILKETATRGHVEGLLLGWGKIRKRQEGYRRRARKFVIN